jgi:hypothetical protein
VPFFAKNFAKNRLDPTHSPKLDHSRLISHREKYNFSPFFAPRKKVPFVAKKIAKNRLDPTRSPKLDHFSPHFAPRKAQCFAIIRFAKQVPFAAFRSAKKVQFFAKKIAKSRLDPNEDRYSRCPTPQRSPNPWFPTD